MSRALYLATFISLVSSVAAADIQVPAVVVKPLPPEHEEHKQCHKDDPTLDKDPYCGPLRKYERDQYTLAAARLGKQTVVLEDGTRKLGVRNQFNRLLVTGLAADSSYNALSWLTRFKIPAGGDGASARPATYEDLKIDSCDEYTYKRYYAPSRYLDVLGTYVTQRRYDKALDAIAQGLPSVGGTRFVFPLANYKLYDFDYRPLTYFKKTFDGNELDPMTPQLTNSIARNVFFSMPVMVSLQGPVDTTDPVAAKYAADLAAAAQKSFTEPRRTLGPTGEFGDAQAMRSHADIVNLTSAERDDITMRLRTMRDTLQSALTGFSRCVTREWFAKSASANILSAKTSVALREYLEANQESNQWTNPNPLELDLQTRLLTDSTTANSAITSLLSSDGKGIDLASQWVRTPTGTMLRLLAYHDQLSMRNAVSSTRSTFKSGTFGNENCALSEDFQRVRDLLVAEYRRGEAGCMATTSKRCDFSPQLFVESVMARLTPALSGADEAKAHCLAVAGPSFDGGLSPVASNVRDNLTEFETFVETRFNQLSALVRGAPRKSTLNDSIGDRYDGSADWGDPGSFGAGYKYSSEWGVNVVQSNANGACRLGGKVNGNLSAYATAFGVKQELVNAGLSALTPQPDKYNPGQLKPASFSAHVALLGKDVFTPISKYEIDSHYKSEDKSSLSVDIIKTTVVIGIVPVSISVGFEFDYGYTLSLDFNQSQCVTPPTLSVTGNVTPHAGASATVSAYVDLFLAGAGVKGRLTLVDARLPFTSTLGTKLDSSGLSVTTESDLDLVLTTLSGGLSFIVNVFGFTVWEHEFFSWPGITHRQDLWHHEGAYPIAAFNLL